MIKTISRLLLEAFSSVSHTIHRVRLVYDNRNQSRQPNDNLRRTLKQPTPFSRIPSEALQKNVRGPKGLPLSRKY